MAEWIGRGSIAVEGEALENVGRVEPGSGEEHLEGVSITGPFDRAENDGFQGEGAAVVLGQGRRAAIAV